MVACSSTVNHRVMASTLGAEFAALATALDRQLDVRLVLESILFVDYTIENPAENRICTERTTNHDRPDGGKDLVKKIVVEMKLVLTTLLLL